MDDCSPDKPMTVETKFLRLPQPVPLGAWIDGWRVCWLGGWDRDRFFFIVMVEKVKRGGRHAHPS
jgi:hypothetical protein